MRKIKNYLKTGILLLGILISTTNCEKDEFSIDSSQTTIDNKSLYEVPNTSSAKENFQNLNNFRNPFNSSSLLAKEKNNTYFIDWNNSKSVNFKKKENINILYTPIIYNKNGKRNKSFIASIANKNNEIESFIFSVFYDRLATDEIFSGYISKFDSSGRAIELYKYQNGLLKTTYTFKKEKNSSKKSYSNRDGYDDCGGTTMEDILFMIDYLLEYGGEEETIYFGNCVYITSSGGGGSGGDNSWSNPDMNLSGGFIPLGENYNYTAGGGGGSSTTSTTTTDVLIAPEGLQWWAEDFDISPTRYLIINIQNITNEQIQWINDPVNSNVVDQLNNYFINNGNFIQSQNFINSAIDALINHGDVDFEEKLIYDPRLEQEFKSRMSSKEIEIFDNLTSFQQYQYLKSAIQAYTYAELHYPKPIRNRMGDAVKHTFWNALSTVRLGASLTKQLTDAHEEITFDTNYPNHYKEKQMDLFNNEKGRQIAYGSGRLYQLIETALANGELRYLSNLTLYNNTYYRASDSSQLIPTNQ